MSSRKATVEAYKDGFRRSDHEQILACLTDDVVWEIHGHVRLAGKEAFDGEIENEAFIGSPTLHVERVVEDAEVIVVTGTGEGRFKSGAVHRFAYCDLFTFAGEQISRVDS
jgi:ketosteroid isomerase-like protein